MHSVNVYQKMYNKHAGPVCMQGKNAQQDANQRQSQTCVHQKPKSEKM
jgi:hypothetical protein